MKSRSLVTVLFVLLLIGSGNAFASTESWWMLCDWCESDADFEHRAINAPGTYTPVYVTNRETNETRKYEKLVIVDDLVDGTRRTVLVYLADFPSAEKLAFEQAVEGANVVFVDIPRNRISGLGWLLDQGSVVGDISQGYIDNRLIVALGMELERIGALPSRLSVNREAGASIAGTGGSVGAGETIRVRDISIEITYLDGSKVYLQRRASEGKLTNFTVTDADGKVIAIENPPDGTTINPGPFADRSFHFGGPGSQTGALVLMNYLRRSSNLVCTASTGSRGGMVVTTVHCARPSSKDGAVNSAHLP